LANRAFRGEIPHHDSPPHPVHPHAPAAPMMRTLPRDVREVVSQIVHVADNVVVIRRQCVLPLSGIETAGGGTDPHAARRIFHDNCGFSLKIHLNGHPRAFIVIAGTRVPHYKIRVSRAMPFDKMHNLRVCKSPHRPKQHMRMVGHDRITVQGKRFQFVTIHQFVHKKIPEYFLLKIRRPSARHRSDEIRRARNVYSFLRIIISTHNRAP